MVQKDEHILQFTVMPLGLNIVPRVFTKFTKIVASILCHQNVESLMYLDKSLVQASSECQACVNTDTTLHTCN